MKKRPKVSILVAVYNVSAFVKKCIESILAQDYKNIEIILVDDCSSDDSGKICDECTRLDKRIRTIHHKKNLGLPETRNTGIKSSSGDYIIFVDGDDWVAKDYVSYLLKVIMSYDAEFGINLVNYTTRDMNEEPEKSIVLWSPEKTTAKLIHPELSIGAWNKIYKRSFLEKNNIRFKPLFTAEGFRFITDVSQRASKIAVGGKRVYYYRLNNTGSATTKYDIRQSLGAAVALNGIRKDLVICTKPVIDALNHHEWENHFWTIRQIIALKNRKEYPDNFKQSKKYLRKNALKAAKMEDRIKTRIKCILCGIIPSFVARVINFKIKIELKRDLKQS